MTALLYGSDTSVESESDVVLAARAGQDEAAFTELYHRHMQRVYRYLLARTGNVEDAQDLTTQTFMAALNGLHRYQGRAAFSTWLLAIARRKVADHFRRRRLTLPLSIVNSLSHPAPDEEVFEELRLQQVARALRRLPAERAEALALRLFAGLSAEEAAEVMEKSEGAVRMLVHRAVKDLQMWLAPREEER